MSISAQVHTDALGNLTVQMYGPLEYETGPRIRQQLLALKKENPWAVITLDLGHLDFVGSSGISHFVETIKILNQHRNHIRLANVKDEFIRVFNLYNLNTLELMLEDLSSEETATMGRFAGKKRTFQN